MRGGVLEQTEAAMMLQSIYNLLPEHVRNVMAFGRKSEFQSTNRCCGVLSISLRNLKVAGWKPMGSSTSAPVKKLNTVEADRSIVICSNMETLLTYTTWHA